MSKMGSGEGNQSFGPGLYFAENPKVSGQGGEYWRTFINRMKATPERHASFAMMGAGWNKEEAIRRLEKERDYYLDRGIPGKYDNGPDVEEGCRLLSKEYDDAANLLRSEQSIAPHTYEVRINANTDHFLDWDHPLKNQSNYVKNAIYDLMKKLNDRGIDARKLSGNVVWSDFVTRHASPMIIDEMDGAAIKSMMDRGFGKNISKEFLDSGIKGIKYFDARSREKKRGTRNYVVFDDKFLSINRRYEQGGAVDDQDEGIQAYHGSPHEFEQFDISKIGTGEGAQSYGHGLYFAEYEPVAKRYRDGLSSSDIQIGKYLYDSEIIADYAKNSKLIDDDIKKNNYIFEKNLKLFAGDNSDLAKKVKKYDLEQIDKLEQLKKIDLSKINIPKGHMYEVRINAHPDHFLDWDKPISKQSEYVRQALGVAIPNESKMREQIGRAHV